MIFDEMVRSVESRLGSETTLVRNFGETEVKDALNEGQKQVAMEMAICHGLCVGVQDMDHEDESGPTPVPHAVVAMSDTQTTCTLPDEYHLPVVLYACKVLAEKSPDVNPKLKIPERLDGQFQSALQRANERYGLTLRAGKPQRVMDGYDPLRHLREDF